MQSITQGVGDKLQPVENNLLKYFLTTMLQGTKKHIAACEVTQLTTKQIGMALYVTTLYDLENCTALCIITGLLVADIWGWEELWSGDHAILMKYFREEILRPNNLNAMRALTEVTG